MRSLRVILYSLLLSVPAAAHERFVAHELKEPLPSCYYSFFYRAGLSPMDPNMLSVGIMVTLALAASLAFWFLRHRIHLYVQRVVLSRLTGFPQRFFHHLSCYLRDRPLRRPWYHSMGEWAVILFLRSPALVLMFSATNDSLVMPSYPLDPSSAAIFKYLQVLLALMILTQTLLPLCGAIIFGCWLFLFNWGAMVAVDAMPVLSVAVVYVTSPWQSHRVLITHLNSQQMRWIRITLGLGFFLLGWLKIVNHDLVAGVAQNYPACMDDPMLKTFTIFTGNPQASGFDYTPGSYLVDPFKLAVWTVSFALAEVMSGFLLFAGVMNRLWATFMVIVFTKLMLVDFGWDEIPHIYPIAALLTIIFSNQLHDEFRKIEDIEEEQARRGETWGSVALIAAGSLVIAIAVILVPLYFTTFLDRAAMGLVRS